jgi:hypothetical protein
VDFSNLSIDPNGGSHFQDNVYLALGLSAWPGERHTRQQVNQERQIIVIEDTVAYFWPTPCSLAVRKISR